MAPEMFLFINRVESRSELRVFSCLGISEKIPGI